jgi:hypothetical protein
MNDNAETQDTPAPGITIQDLQTVVNIIDACTKRGSFEGNELLIVGQTREKIAAFIKANIPTADTNAEAKTEE